MRRGGRLTLLACLVLALAVSGTGLGQAGGRAPVTISVDQRVTQGSLNLGLVGFNWREGGESVAPLGPKLIRLWGVDFSRITPAPGIYDWTVPDAETEAAWAMGATPLIVLVGRPPWSPDAGSAGYQEAVEQAMRRYGVDRVPEGSEPASFESSNEPEFTPTAHGQLPWELPFDVIAQAQALRSVESSSGAKIRWGGPGALFPDPPVVAAFALAAAAGGRPADFLSWHSYTNQPFLGPDGVEYGDDPLFVLGYTLLRGHNPVATPLIVGVGAEIMRLVASAFTSPDGGRPDLLLTEWHLSSGGLDRRHDTHEGAAHTLASLIELQHHGVDAATFFAAADRHCPQPAGGPHPLCGDWGTTTADGTRKPVWWAFDWWGAMEGEVVLTRGANSVAGLWSLGTVRDGKLRVLVVSWSASVPMDRTVTVRTKGEVTGATVRHLDRPGSEEPAVHQLGPGLSFRLKANTAALVELNLAG